MQYHSTRGGAPVLDFRGATLAGLAKDGGLYVPDHWPELTRDEIAALAGLDYIETAVRVMAPFTAGTLDETALRTLCQAAYGRFAHAAVTPLVQLDANHWLLELFHGPTLAFKDVALQLLGLMFERFLSGGDTHLTVIGATSGDTGSAAIDALAGRAGIDIFMLHPLGRVSEVQRRQMTTVLAPNVHNIAVEGNFDDAQALVKAMFNAPDFAQRFSLGAVNSINWARLMAQVVYYFAAALQLGAPQRKAAFSVPTGNFGDVLAGWYAKEMGCSCRGLVVATNANDILARFFASGTYSRPPSAVETLAPSMDICVSSNFERFVFHCSGNDAAQTKSLMDQFEKTGAFTAPPALKAKAQAEMKAASVQKEEILATIKSRKEATGYVLDPHTACGVRAAEDLKSQLGSGPVICLACAHHGKFPAAINAALGDDAKSVPPEKALTDLLSVPHRKDILENSARAVIDFVEKTMASRKPAAKKARTA